MDNLRLQHRGTGKSQTRLPDILPDRLKNTRLFSAALPRRPRSTCIYLHSPTLYLSTLDCLPLTSF